MKLTSGGFLALCTALVQLNTVRACSSAGQGCQNGSAPCCNGLYCVGTPSSAMCRFYPTGYNYQGEFTDQDLPWDPNLLCLVSSPGQKQLATHRSALQNVLNLGSEAAYGDVVQFSNDSNKTRVHFTLTLPDSPKVPPTGAKLVQLRLKDSLVSSENNWTDIIVQPMQPASPAEPVSQSQGWKDAARMLLDAIDTTVDPCDDFYAFACNKFIETHDPKHTDVGTFSDLLQRVVSEMRYLWESYPINGSKGPKSVETAARFYRACRNAKPTDYQGGTWLLNVLKSFGGWPIITEDWKIPAAPYDTMAYLMADLASMYNVPSLLTPNVEVDWKNVSRQRITISQATLSDEPAIFVKSETDANKIRVAMSRGIEKAAMILANYTVATLRPELLAKDVVDMVELEFELARISALLEDKKNRSLLYNPYTPTTANAKWPAIDWTAYITALVQNRSVSKDSFEMFVIREEPFITALNTLLSKNYSSPDGTRVLYNYLVWKFVSAYQQFGGPDFPDSGPFPPGKCVNLVKQLIPWAAGRLYIDNLYTDETQSKVELMVNTIISTFRAQLSGLSWMDDQSKLATLKKTNHLVTNIGYPAFVKNDALLDQHYGWLIDLVASQPNMDFLDFYLVTIQFQWANTIRKLDEKPDRTDFRESPSHAGAWYRWDMNSLTIAAALVNQPLFRSDFPMAINYGGLGPGIGHELTHAFDDFGIQHDYNGTLHEWMSEHSKKGFSDMARCVIDQYSKFCYPFPDNTTLCVNGQLTQGENIADGGGLKPSYYGYKAFETSNGQEARLPNMESYTMDQIFFLSYANFWCAGTSDGYLKTQLLTNDHAPFGSARVNGPLQNFEPFATAFGCRAGTRMVPQKRCKIW